VALMSLFGTATMRENLLLFFLFFQEKLKALNVKDYFDRKSVHFVKIF
jgi:hypothetical protein